MKKKICLIVLIAIVATLSFVFAGCETEVKNKYVVSFDTAYGSSVTAQLVEEGGKVTVPDNPDREGYTFAGWYKDEACTEGSEFKFDADTVSATMTIYAKWTPVQSEDVDNVNGFVYTVIEGTRTLSVSAVKDFDYGKQAEVLATYNGMPVVEIAEYGMRNMTAAELILPNSIEKIGDYAFYGNADVTVVDLYASSAEIGASAFQDSGLMAIDLGAATKIGANAFQNSQLSFLTIPATVTEIGDAALDANTLTEIGFAGEFPVLGAKVFGVGDKPLGDGTTERVSFYASESAWNTLVADEKGDTFEEKVKAALDVNAGYIMYLNPADLATAGVYYGDVDVYMGVGSYAVIVEADEISTVEVYAHTHAYLNLDDVTQRQTVVLDPNTGRTEILKANERGEVIKNGTLYDYVGEETWYEVSDSVNTVAAGAGVMNAAVRMLSFGDNVTAVGDYVFFNSNLFSVSFGTGIDTIGDYAFLNNSYIQEIIFRGETAPSYVGAGAFCYIDTVGFIPVAFANEAYGAAKIWTPLEYVDGWWSSSEVGDFLAVLNAGLEQLGDQLAKDGENPIRYTDGNDGMFGKLSTSGQFALGATYAADFGKVIMSGTGTHYVYISLNEGDYDGNGAFAGSAYGYWSYATGDDDSNASLKFEILYGFTHTEQTMRNFFAYGKLDSDQFVTRGGEYGVFGELGKEIVNLDGYGKITYNTADGNTFVGTYVKDGETLTVSGIEGIQTINFAAGTDGSAASVTYGGKTLTALGAEAGVYYDYANRAKLEMDGKSYTEGDKTYSGKLILTYNGVVAANTGYVVDGSYIKFNLNGTDKSWDYSRTASDYVVKGYYDNSYNLQMKFIVETATELRGEYTGANGTLTLDGYFSGTQGDKVVTYTVFDGVANIAVFDTEGNVEIVYLNTEDKTYTVASAPEAGMYYVGSSASYRLYLDGQGKLIYYSGSYAYGTYEFDAEKGVIKSKINTENASTTDGMLDLEKGYGYLVYDYYGDTYMAVSKVPFTVFNLGSWTSASLSVSVIGYAESEGEWSDFSVSLSVYQSGTILFFSEYGQPFTIYDLGNDFSDSLTFTVNMTTSKFKATDVKFTASVSKEDVISLTAELSYAGGTEVLTVVEGEGESAVTSKYMLCWLNEEKTLAGVYEIKEYGSSIFCGSIEWTVPDSAFKASKIDIDSGDYFEISVTGYGTEEQKVELISTSGKLYDSSDKAEHKYYKINIFSDTQLWVANDYIDGAEPEIANYTVEEIEGVKYYTFTSTATNKVVTFHWTEGGYFSVDSEVDPS